MNSEVYFHIFLLWTEKTSIFLSSLQMKSITYFWNGRTYFNCVDTLHMDFGKNVLQSWRIIKFHNSLSSVPFSILMLGNVQVGDLCQFSQMSVK